MFTTIIISIYLAIIIFIFFGVDGFVIDFVVIIVMSLFINFITSILSEFYAQILFESSVGAFWHIFSICLSVDSNANSYNFFGYYTSTTYRLYIHVLIIFNLISLHWIWYNSALKSLLFLIKKPMHVPLLVVHIFSVYLHTSLLIEIISLNILSSIVVTALSPS